MARNRRRRRFVLDTNILVSAALTPGGVASEVARYISQQGYFVFSAETFAEFREVLYRSVFDSYLTNQDRRAFVIPLLRKSVRVETTEAIQACSDPDDDKFLDVAVAGKAECIVTRNVGDFPADSFRDVLILTPEQFLDHERR